MRKHKIVIVVSAGILLTLLAYIFILPNFRKMDDMPGIVIGNNFKHIPESKLPECVAPIGEIINEPCYSPPGMMYL